MSGTTSRQFQAVITVDDRTAGPLAVISARLRAIAGMSGMERIRAAALGVQRSFGALAGSAARLAVVGGGIGVGLGAGLVAAMNAAVDAGGALSDLSERLGMSAEDIQAYGFAFEQAGVNSEQFAGAMEKLNRGLGDAAAGRNQALAGLFARLGISLRGANGQVRSAADVLPQLAQAMQRNENAAVRTRIAMTVFGRAGGPLITALAAGAAGLREQTDRWRELDGQITGQSVGALDEVGDGMNEVRHSLLGVRNAIAVQLAPVLAPLFGQFATWIASNRDLVATNVRGWIEGVAEWVQRIDFTQVREGLSQFLSVAQRVFDAIGGWRGVIVGVIAVITGPLLAAIATLTAALLTNPIGAAVAAIGLAAAAIYLYWDDIVGFFQGIWDGISSAVSRFANSEQVVWLRDVFAALGRGIAAGWDALAGFFERLWTGIGDAVGRFMASEQVQWLGDAFSTLAGGLMEAWAPIEGFFRSLWSGVSSAFTAAWAVIEPIVNAVVAGAQALAAILPERGSGRTAGGSGPLAPQGQGLGRSGAAGGFYGGPAIDPDTGRPAFEPLYRQQSAPASAAAAPQGEVRVRMSFDNVPRGARVDADAQGTGVRQPELDVGYATMGAF
ncbi:phage tail tape measure protein [Roseomonas sp. HJA6]|uniref:Phage tail tape measure protein n=1 Tax=Roseomonas alba TaxID=2846776 RepID=A0ABS7AFN3_9PROT|nr:phage tail tape measure protein [Neoroseomonas alba]MBW6399979.1 phage tail tape measure protein [Neoroseomonas alba]